jgi:hypothetical protein
MPALDAGLLAAAQAVEHYQISRHGTLKCWAGELGYNDAVKPLDTTLNEEKKTDATLTRLAEAAVNITPNPRRPRKASTSIEPAGFATRGFFSRPCPTRNQRAACAICEQRHVAGTCPKEK